MRRSVRSALILSLAGLCAGAVGLRPGSVSAQCGTFVADEGDNMIFYGVMAQTYSVTSTCVGTAPEIVLGNQQAAVCWRDKDGIWRYEDVLGCNSATPASEGMLILGAGGDDVVMPVVHYRENEEFVCPVPGTSGTLHWSGSTPPSFAMLEWYDRYAINDPRGGGCVHPEGCESVMDFPVSIQGGRGEDELHGAPTDDQVLSANLFGDPWCLPHGGRGSGDTALDECVCATDVSCCNMDWDWDCIQLASGCGADCSDLTSLEADQSMDILCGHGGDDLVMGDEDPSPFAFDLLSGGPGSSDFCRGIVQSTSPCCAGSTSAGCSDSAIESLVCAADPYCCTTAWDGLCVDQVTTVAGATCDVGMPPCCAASSGSGCMDDAVIEAAVCAVDPYCCTTAWDNICVGRVVTDAGASCDPITDIATDTCDTVFEAAVSSTGDGALARSVCGDDDPESLPTMPATVAGDVLTRYRTASDTLLPSCW